MDDTRELKVNQFETIEDLDSILEKDEHEERYEKAVKNRSKVKRRRKRRKRLALALLILLIIAYFATPISNVRSVQVSNNVIYTKDEVLKKANISYNDKLLFKLPFLVESTLEDDPFIKNATVSENYIDGSIHIRIEEMKVIGYYVEEGKTRYLLADGEEVEVKKQELALVGVPYINSENLGEEQRKKLQDGLKDLSNKDIQLISEVRHYETSYDKDMVELMMNDGHIVRSTFAGLPLMKHYVEILKGIKSEDMRCIVLVEETGNAYTTKCE